MELVLVGAGGWDVVCEVIGDCIKEKSACK